MPMKSAKSPLSLKARAVALLAQREHSVVELRRKLTRIAAINARAATDARASTDARAATGAATEEALDAPEVEVDTAAMAEEVESVLAWLQQQGYLDEARFVDSRIHVRSHRWGQRRIEQELSQHGLSLDAHQRAQLAEGELDRAVALLHRKFGSSPSPDGAIDPAQHARQMRFLLGRGFSGDLIRRAMRAWAESLDSSSDAP